MKALTKQKLSDMVAHSIIEYIYENKLAPGDPIPTEKEIAEEFHIGKTSVREGIIQLKTAGLLDSNQGGRVFVKQITLENYLMPKSKLPLYKFLVLSEKQELDIIEFRRLLETSALRKAINKDLSALTKKLSELASEMSKYCDNVEKFISYDEEFHKQIFIYSENSVLPIIFDVIWGLYRRQFIDFSLLPNAIDRALLFHKEMVLHLTNGRTQQAIDSLNNHLIDMENHLNGFLSEV